ncbi:uncharacterized protein LOC123201262 [Mangifera indica]|uniref:uncharacterized protein LOC123201262 n=1 Tax=Mangifera indica TaxID=29780 RepID=UPI001CFB55D0|nr:uncharacterized protein LOC123201262 [Mangifera indica]XP_044472612.1 uncharacterized protein LOC123201262 [Mangifera indica]XP_044472613.1 uncharacterized protein LOC123201262 [Mangifera indica]XP_044472614.1 uncharacterized protein LOC123201262 [Mangifera indica]XP_044472615.1 uncharacterized protein LOC123201262 [Mangifera indica]XP_044472617.1 uncharacterized protein LOC123201262 [Mangifera indica]XP_044472618.1 uncharacterized protein LOC123201262 [Mangifera indica]XP_044472619.1 unc
MATNTTSGNQRKHAMEALERRFAIAKAEALQQMKHGKKRPLEEDEKGSDSSAIASSPHLTDASVMNSPIESAKRGNFTFVGYTTSQDVELSGPTYFQLTQPMHENLLATDCKQSNRRGSTVDKVLHELFQNGDSAQKYLQGSRSVKIDNWLLLDNYVQGRAISTSSHVRALQTHSKRSKKHMSMKQLKKSGLFDLPKELQRFETFNPMHEMWKAYVLQLIKTTGKNQLAQCLLSADLHGALILVAECKIAAFTGVSGIMVRETAETFGIVTREDKFRVVPKKDSVFIFQVDCWKITLLGNKLTSRNVGL